MCRIMAHCECNGFNWPRRGFLMIANVWISNHIDAERDLDHSSESSERFSTNDVICASYSWVISWSSCWTPIESLAPSFWIPITELRHITDNGSELKALWLPDCWRDMSDICSPILLSILLSTKSKMHFLLEALIYDLMANRLNGIHEHMQHI